MRALILMVAIFVGSTQFASAYSESYIQGHLKAFAPGDSSTPSVDVRPLDDPANPYRGDYGPFDHWCWEHFNRSITRANDPDWQVGLSQAEGYSIWIGPESMPTMHDLDGLKYSYSCVDANGYMIPHAVMTMNYGTETDQSLRKAIERRQQNFRPEYSGFWSLGPADPVVIADINEMRDRYFAAGYPTIPKWAADRHADMVFLPDGGVVLVSDQGDKPLAERYDASGNLVSQADMPQRDRWQATISPLADLSKSPYYQEKGNLNPSFPDLKLTNNQTYGGRYEVLAIPGSKDVAVIDYWENKTYTTQTEGADLLDRLTIDTRYFNRFNKDIIAAAYAAQQKYGVKP